MIDELMMMMMMMMMMYEPGADNYSCQTIVWWVQKIHLNWMGKVRFCEMSSPPEKRHTVSLLAPLARRKKLWRRGGDDDFGATTKQPRPRATHLLKRLCRLKVIYARFATNSNGFWLKSIMAIASSRTHLSATTWRVLAMSKILWTKQRLVAGRTLSQLVEGWSYCT